MKRHGKLLKQFRIRKLWSILIILQAISSYISSLCRGAWLRVRAGGLSVAIFRDLDVSMLVYDIRIVVEAGFCENAG